MTDTILEKKVERLDVVLDGFIASTNAMMFRMERNTEKLGNRLDQTISEMKHNSDKFDKRLDQTISEMKQDTENLKVSLDQTISEMKQDTENLKVSLDKTIDEMKQDTENLKVSLDKTIDEMKQDTAKMKQNTEKMKKEMNKKWGDLANKMGTVVEDIVAPNIPEIARKYFGVEAFDDFAIRYNRKNRVDSSKIKEFDIIFVSKDIFIVNETKATARETYVDEFVITQL
ncbi:MAG: hypothetical protein HQK67_07245 [Desulfamplus sp.]|nr:hypothetical protein [Desulfamplus sp.]